MPLPALKIVAALGVFAAALLGGWLPLRIGAGDSERRALGWGSALAAGIFLGTGLILLEAEARELWRELGASPAWAPVLTAVGFLTLLLLEHVVFSDAAHAAVHAHAGEPGHLHGGPTLVEGRLPYAVLLALSVHSLIAGVALGTQQNLETAGLILAGVVAHKTTDAVVLGLSLRRAAIAPPRARALITSFALVTPIGILIGTGAHGLVSASGVILLDAILLPLTAGTFVYIGAMDLLQDERLGAGSRLVQWTLATVGLALTAALALLH